MGQTLSEPVSTKTTGNGEDDRLIWGVSEMQGWRMSMEDAHTHVLNLEGSDEDKKHSYFAVYDGHGGPNVAKFSGEHTHNILAAEPAFKSRDYIAALKNAFLGTDVAIKNDEGWDPAGCTATAVLITPDLSLYCANAGDSRSVLAMGGKAVAISNDHKPTNFEETERITNAGGFVQFGRVNGNLALSRAIGDFDFKLNDKLGADDQIVTANPEIIYHQATAEDEFVVLACDGIWDVLSSQQVVDFIRRRIAQRMPLADICEALLDFCLAPDASSDGVGCDNMTALIVGLKGKRTTEEWYDWIAQRVENNVGYPTPATIESPYNYHSSAYDDTPPRSPHVFPLARDRDDDDAYGIGADDSDSSFLALQKLAMHLAKRASAQAEADEPTVAEGATNSITEQSDEVEASETTPEASPATAPKVDTTSPQTKSDSRKQEPTIVQSPASVTP